MRQAARGAIRGDVALAYHDLGTLHASTGDGAKSLECFQAAAVAWEEALRDAMAPSRFRTLVKLAETYRSYDEYQKAMHVWQTLVDLCQKSSYDSSEMTYAVTEGKTAQRYAHLNPDEFTMLRDADRQFRAAFGASGEEVASVQKAPDALAVRKRLLGDKHTEYLDGLLELATLASHVGNVGIARASCEEAVVISQRLLGPNHLRVADAMAQLAETDLERDGDSAELNARDSLAILHRSVGQSHPKFQSGLLLLATLLLRKGKHAEAGQLLQIATSDYSKSPPDTSRLRRLSTLANLLTALGDVRQAEPLCRQVLALARAHLGPRDPQFGESLLSLANLYQWIGDYENAGSFHAQYLDFSKAVFGRNASKTGAALLRLGLLHLENGQHDQAERYSSSAAEICETGEGGERLLGQSLMIRAQVAEARGNYDEAGDLFSRALEALARSPGEKHREYIDCQVRFAEFLVTHREYPRARRMFENAMASLTPGHPLRAECLTSLAGVEARLNDWDKAVSQTDAARRIVRQYICQTLPILSEHEQARFLQNRYSGPFHQSVSVGIGSPGPASAFYAYFSGASPKRCWPAGWTLNGKAVVQESLAARAWDPEAADKYVHYQRTLAAMARHWIQLQQDPDKSREEYEKLEREKVDIEKALSEKVPRAGGSTWMTIEDVQRALSANSVLIEYLRFAKTDYLSPPGTPRAVHYGAWTIRKDVVTTFDLGPAERIDASITTLQRAIKSIGVDSSAALAELAQLILQPLEKAIGSKDRWVVSPDAALWLVPFAALPDGKNKHAIEGHRISYISRWRRNRHGLSGRNLTDARPQQQFQSPVVFADPDFESEELRTDDGAPALAQRSAVSVSARAVPASWRPLPGTADEAQRIVPELKKYANVEPIKWSGRSATEANFRALHSPRVLVLSTHGYFAPGKPDDPLQSLTHPLLRFGLALAGANRASKTLLPTEDDGILTGLEIVGTDLRGTELVVLSACETGLGDIQQGEGVAGLRQAFHLAGARTVISTLWRIPDRETVQLMDTFWKEMANGKDAVDALRHAQISMIRQESKSAEERGLELMDEEGSQRPGTDRRHPYFWAAFTLTGQPAVAVAKN